MCVCVLLLLLLLLLECHPRTTRLAPLPPPSCLSASFLALGSPLSRARIELARANTLGRGQVHEAARDAQARAGPRAELVAHGVSTLQARLRIRTSSRVGLRAGGSG
uniref:Secreted protein n=1 Tax=Alexandrium monilatum TaxID=311494 RepID=A0A7S4UY01_9DINO